MVEASDAMGLLREQEAFQDTFADVQLSFEALKGLSPRSSTTFSKAGRQLAGDRGRISSFWHTGVPSGALLDE